MGWGWGHFSAGSLERGAFVDIRYHFKISRKVYVFVLCLRVVVSVTWPRAQHHRRNTGLAWSDYFITWVLLEPGFVQHDEIIHTAAAAQTQAASLEFLESGRT